MSVDVEFERGFERFFAESTPLVLKMNHGVLKCRCVVATGWRVGHPAVTELNRPAQGYRAGTRSADVDRDGVTRKRRWRHHYPVRHGDMYAIERGHAARGGASDHLQHLVHPLAA